MKLLRYGPAGQEKPGLLDADGTIRDLSGHIADITGATLDAATLSRLAALDAGALPAVPGKPRVGPCVGQVPKYVCVGLNYSDHAAETNLPIPSEPIIFMKAISCIIGPDDEVMLPKGSVKGDWEVELGIVMGRTARYVDEASALDYVAGYCVCNDVSEREYQIERLGQWVKGKSADTFGPIGPWVVTKDEIADTDNLEMFCNVSGVRRQTGNTRTMIFKVPFLISYISQFMTLQAGDVIATGTPPGVGLGMKPPQFLKAGDVMTVGIQGLGTQQQKVVPFKGRK